MEQEYEKEYIYTHTQTHTYIWLNICITEPFCCIPETKGKGEKGRYTNVNTEFPRIARRDKKAFLSDQCKEIEEKNRMGKTGDPFKKIRDTKEYFMQRWAQ